MGHLEVKSLNSTSKGGRYEVILRSNRAQNDDICRCSTVKGAFSRADSRMIINNHVVVTIVCTVRVCIMTNTKSTRCSSERPNIDFTTNARFHHRNWLREGGYTVLPQSRLSTALISTVRGRQSVDKRNPRNPFGAGWKFWAIQILTEKIIYAEISFLLY